MLLPGQSAYDRPDIVCRVFHARKNALIHNLKSGCYFEGRKCAYILHVIEYQHRGLPHAHIVYRLTDGPNHSDENECIAFMDDFITAKKPVCDEDEADPEEIRYCMLVDRDMTHKCSDNEVNGCLDCNGLCKKKYSPLPVLETYLDDKSYPVYARPEEKDCYVVPHVKQMLLDCDCHINTEFCASSYTLIYLYKYLFKGEIPTYANAQAVSLISLFFFYLGNKKIQLELHNTDDVHEKDEIKMFLRGRMMSSMEACWRVFNYQTYPGSNPPVSTIKLKTADQLQMIQEKNKTCDFDVYLNRPPALLHLTFVEFFKSFDYTYDQPAGFADSDDLSLFPSEDGKLQCEVVTFQHTVPKSVYLKRLKADTRIIRLNPVPFNSGELWYMRLLLRHTYPVSIADMYSCNGHRFETFQEACVEHHLLDNDDEAMLAFEELLTDHVNAATPPELRALFVLLTLQGFPTIRIYRQYLDHLMADLQLENDCLLDLQIRFSRENKNMEDYGLPLPEAMNQYFFLFMLKNLPTTNFLMIEFQNASRPRKASR